MLFFTIRKIATIRVTMFQLIESIIAQHLNGIGISVIEAEIHNRQGNLARYRLRRSEYGAWL